MTTQTLTLARISGRLRKPKAESSRRRPWRVQLHVVGHVDDDPAHWYTHALVIASWAPQFVHTLAEAEALERRLRRDNRWGDADRWPTVSVSPASTSEWKAGDVLTYSEWVPA